MKQNGLLGKGSGKLGSSVFSISGGVQIVREYNPNVSNPNTDAQINQRAKFKLMSQIAADLASVIVIPKKGLASARNMFVSKNIGLVVSTAGEATVNYVALQLTASDSAFPAVTGRIDGQGTLGVELAKMPAADVQKVVYCAFTKDDTNQLSLIGTTIIDRENATNNFATSFANAADAYVVYAYGIKASAIAANPNYDNYVIEGATDIARLVASRSISLDASGTTRTSGVLVAADALSVVSLSVLDDGGDPVINATPGEVCGPVVIMTGYIIKAEMSASAGSAILTNPKMQVVKNGNGRVINLGVDSVDGNSVTMEYTEQEGVDGGYITMVSFELDGVNHSIRFAQP